VKVVEICCKDEGVRVSDPSCGRDTSFLHSAASRFVSMQRTHNNGKPTVFCAACCPSFPPTPAPALALCTRTFPLYPHFPFTLALARCTPHVPLATRRTLPRR
jgi:hypothetical protein